MTEIKAYLARHFNKTSKMLRIIDYKFTKTAYHEPNVIEAS